MDKLQLIKKSVITIAVGKPYYLQLAENLLQSFLLWNHQNDIHFLLITDNAEFYRKYKDNSQVNIRQIPLSESEKSFTAKFKLFEYSNAEENLFIDCDCLIYKDLGSVFESFNDSNFSAIGNTIKQGEFFCDVKKTIAEFKLSALSVFVGSVYYFKKNDIAQRIFDTAIELKTRYDELGFIRLRGKENEEPLFAVALGLAGETLLSNDGDIKVDLMCYHEIASNILKGKATARKPNLEVIRNEKVPDVSNPAILHFNGAFSESYYYKSELFRLRYFNMNTQLINTLILILLTLPFLTEKTFKNYFRPLYHSLWGYRSIKKSDRIYTSP